MMDHIQLSYRSLEHIIKCDGKHHYLPGGPIGWYRVVSANASAFGAVLDYWDQCGRIQANTDQSAAAVGYNRACAQCAAAVGTVSANDDEAPVLKRRKVE